MSYPPARYQGEGGEVSAALRPHDTPPEPINPAGGGAAYLATGASTHGQFGLYLDYFETLADAARREAMDERARTEFFLRHDTHWV